ncbi:MAG TPA: hypothetical protein VJI98_05965 [Candidatus Nanoarchaeia archaeon]|nr:hypothetical protein [Candidatus Nanoarchaeia archaeon]
MPKFSKKEIKEVINPLIERLIEKSKRHKTLIAGIQGGQGTGKTTLVNFVKQRLRKQGFKVQSFSIDDFYETYRFRREWSGKNPGNPFYQIARGMPGTHRVKLLKQVLAKIKAGKPFEIPIFDKFRHQGQGDVSKRMIKVNERQDFVLFEGWCVGIPKVSSRILINICKKNDIPLKQLDPELQYHLVMLKAIKDYLPLWKYLNYIVMLQADSAQLHQKWRLQQERELKIKKNQGMTPKEIINFVNVYLPLTYVCYEKIKADAKIKINSKHEFYSMDSK